MDGSTNSEGTIDQAAALRNCLVYLLQDAKEANLGWCALHLKIAISELNSVMDSGAEGASGKARLGLCGHSGD